MNKISPLDIRIAVLAYPLVCKEYQTYFAQFQKLIAPYNGDERIVSLFQNTPKPSIELVHSKVPLILRKGQLAILRLYEVLKALLAHSEKSTVIDDIFPPRSLLVPQLPHPPFQAVKPPRFFWHPAYVSFHDEYAPSCLMSEEKEEAATLVYNSKSICAHARRALTQKGILKQDSEGFIYLALPAPFISEIFPLIHDEACEAIPLDSLEPSSAHIPVILPQEWSQRKGWGPLKEIEESFSFEITRFFSLKPKRWPGIEKVYCLEIQSPELEKYRELHRLSPRIRGYNFHIAIAFKKAKEEPAQTSSKETFRLNVSCFAA